MNVPDSQNAQVMPAPNARWRDLGVKVAETMERNFPDWTVEFSAAVNTMCKLLDRETKYRTIVFVLFVLSYFNPVSRFLPGRPVGVAPGLFTAYFFCRAIDDMADGDTAIPDDFDDFASLVQNLKQGTLTKNFEPHNDLMLLLRATIHDTIEYGGTDPSDMLLQFIDAMKTEHERRTSRQVSTRNELYSLYQDSFSTPQDIAFIHLWSSCRSADLPELADLQGRLYAVRDLRDDLARGIFFIPGEVIEQSGLDADKLIDNPQLADTNECVQAWRRSELVEGAKLIEQLGEKELDWKARLLVKFLTKGIGRYIQAQDVERMNT